jgi:mycothiol synthase
VDAAFAVAAAQADAHGRFLHFGRPDLAQAWTLPELELDRDTWIVEDADSVVAVAWLSPQPLFAEVYVDPRAAGRGIGSALLPVVEARAAQRGDTLIQAVAGTDAAGRALLESAGYIDAHRYTMMRIELDGSVPAPPLPTGIEVRPFAPATDDRAVFEVDAAAFADLPDFLPQPFDLWRVEHVEASGVRAAASPLAWAGERLVAFALNQMRAPGLGYVEILAVDAAWRGRGLGRALLVWSFAALRDEGASAVALGVAGHNDRARGLYEAVGMRPTYVVHRYDKRL